MYRIVINPADGTWVLQLQIFGLFWKQIGTEAFSTYTEARATADKLGLDNVYRDYACSYAHQVLRGPL